MALTKLTYSMIQGATLNVLDFGADPTGVADSYPAFAAALAAMPATGGVITVPDGAAYKLDTTVIVTKPVVFEIGSTTITGPTNGYMFHFTTRFCGLKGNGKTVLKLSSPATPITPAVLTPTLVGGAITSVAITNAGANYQSRPICLVTGENGNGAFVRPELAGGSYGTTVGSATIVDGGQNYTSVTLTMVGGGAGIIKTEGNNCVFKDFVMDMSSVPYAVGFHHWSGWYNDERNITMIYGTDHATAIFYLIECQPAGTVPYDGGIGGGSYAATYVSYWENIGSGGIMAFNGGSNPPLTTLSVVNIDVRQVWMHYILTGTFIRFTVQNNQIPLISIANSANLSFIGSHFEGSNNGTDYFPICYSLSGQTRSIKAYGGEYSSIANNSTPGKWLYYNSPAPMRGDCFFDDNAVGIYLPQENFVEGYGGVRFNSVISGAFQIELSNSYALKFPTTGLLNSDPNSLDIYEEGTWTPGLFAASGSAITVTYASRSGTFTRIGNVVTLRGTMTLSSFTAGSEPLAWIGLNGQPYSVSAGSVQVSRMTASGFSSTTTPSVLQIGTSNQWYFAINDSADARDVCSTRANASMFNGDEVITVTATYNVT